MVENAKWFVVYTKPRWEKKVNQRLLEAGFLSYCPLNKIRKKWSDRYKMVEEPLFKSYVFVRMTSEMMSRVRMISGVLNFVYWNGKPGIVKEDEIETIKRFTNEHEQVSLLPIDLKKDEKVTIHRGVFMDQQAKVQKVLNNKLEVLIESLNYKLIAYIDRSNIVHSAE